jgi:hypothetical protein
MGRPLWRIGTKKAIDMLKEAEAVRRAQLQEIEDALLLAECKRRGWVVTSYCQCAVCKRAWHLPPLADDDEPLPFEVIA